MSNVEQQIARTLDSFGVRAKLLVVAVSGGADSLALLAALHTLQKTFELTLHAAHLDHGLRGDDSAADAAFVRQQCTALDVPVTIERCDIRAAAEETHTGIEVAARNLRYHFLIRTAQSVGASWVALAHNADDQVETVLHRLVRGTGLAGLCGMPVSRLLADGITLVRPLLNVTRAEIEAHLHARGLAWREDSSNASLEFTRNRIRHRLLPLLRAEFNPQVDAALLNLSRQAHEADSIVQAAAAELLQSTILDSGQAEVRLDCNPLKGASPHLIRAMLSQLWRQQDWPAGAMTFIHWETLSQLAQGDGAAVSLPGGMTATRRAGLLHLKKQ